MAQFEVELALKEQGTKISRLEADVKKLGSSARTTQGKLDRFAGTVTKMTAAVAGYIAVSKGLDIGSNIAKGVLNTAASFEKYLTILKTLEGSQAKAEKSFDWIKKFAKDTPYELEQITQAFVKLKSYGLDTTGLTIYGDTAAAMGKDIIQVVEAVADSMTGSNERLKELGITASSINADKVGYEWRDSAGKTQSVIIEKNKDIIESTIQAIWNEKYQGAMNDLSTTWIGLTSNLADGWTQFQSKVAKDTGIFDSLKESVRVLIAEFDNIAPDTAKLESFGRTMKNIISSTISGINFVVQAFSYLGLGIDTVKNGFSQLFAYVQKGFNSLNMLAAESALKMAGWAKSLAFTSKASKNAAIHFKQLQKEVLKLQAEDIKLDIQIEGNSNDLIQKVTDTEILNDSFTKLKEKLKEVWEPDYVSKFNNELDKTKKKTSETVGSAGTLKDKVVEMKSEMAGVNQTGFVEYLELTGRTAEAATLKLQKQIVAMAESGQLTPEQLTEAYTAGENEINQDKIDAKIAENEKLLSTDLNYLQAKGEYEKAYEVEMQAFKDQLALSGATGSGRAEQEMAHAESLKIKYKELTDQELENQNTVENGFNKYMENVKARANDVSNTTEELMHGIEASLVSSFTNFFDSTKEGFMDVKSLFKDMTKSILQEIQKVIIKKMVAAAISMFAKGGVFSGGGEVSAFAKGGVVSAPTFFPMSGGQKGLMGESGPEAIMPLQRDSAGSLGVKVNGGEMGSAQPVVNVVINNNSSAQVTQTTDSNGNINIELIDKLLAQRTLAGKSETDKVNNKVYTMSKK